MKSKFRTAIAVTGSFVLGLGTASILYAQAKPPAYTFVEIDLKDQDGYAIALGAMGQVVLAEQSESISPSSDDAVVTLVGKRSGGSWVYCDDGSRRRAGPHDYLDGNWPTCKGRGYPTGERHRSQRLRTIDLYNLADSRVNKWA
jgi:hypothetical protein